MKDAGLGNAYDLNGAYDLYGPNFVSESLP
jgi:hypothetical protein